jgi:type IV secretion system protein VirD4
MTPFANATTRLRAALGSALGLAACVLFLLVASNVLLLGLRLHDGGLHWSEIVTGWPRYGADPRFDRWLTLATLAGVVVVFGMLGAVLRHRPLPLHGSARFVFRHGIRTPLFGVIGIQSGPRH